MYLIHLPNTECIQEAFLVVTKTFKSFQFNEISRVDFQTSYSEYDVVCVNSMYSVTRMTSNFDGSRGYEEFFLNSAYRMYKE
jgi:hypothetical protein